MSHIRDPALNFEDVFDVRILLLGASRQFDHFVEATRRTGTMRADFQRVPDPEDLDHFLRTRTVDVAVLDGTSSWSKTRERIHYLARYRPFCGTILTADNEPDTIRESLVTGIATRLPRTDSAEQLVETIPWAVRRALDRARQRVVCHKIDGDGFAGMICLDRDLRVRYYNERAQQDVRRLSGESLSLRKEAASILSKGLASFEEGCRHAFRGSTLTREIATDDEAEGTYLECTYEPLHGAESTDPAGVCLGLKDVSSRHRAEARATETENMFWTFVDLLPAGVSVFDPEGRIVRANEAFRDFMGESEVIGRSLEAILHPDDVTSSLERFGELVEGNEPIAKLERRYQRGDGEVVWADVVEMAIPKRSGSPRFIIDFVTDVTERKQLEREAEHAERMRALGQLAGGVAHDFNNLLSVVMSYTHLLEQSFELEEAREYIAKIFEAAERGSRLANQLLAFGRRRSSEPEPLQVNDVVHEFSDMLSCLMPEDIDVELILDESAPPIRADQRQIEQALMNLALNARDAMPDGGRMQIETSRISARDDAAIEDVIGANVGLKLVVRDTGRGMEEDVQDRIFEPFFTTKERDRGTGLGLSTVYGIVVDQHGGDIRVDSEPGEGTIFEILLPAFEECLEEEGGAARESEVFEGDETILVVEDDESLRAPIRTVLEQHGYEVLEASNAEEALEIVDSTDLDLLITDLVMPELDGVGLAERLGGTRPDLDVILMSGYPGDVVDERTDGEPSWPMLEKPFTMEELCTEVRTILDTNVV
jgi:PAS domain S-box-containing protein